MIDISVIVVTYNQESTIRRTLDSILSQVTEARYEIIIGDDCSTDNTCNICREYAERFPDRIVYLRRPTNLGVVRNYFDCIEKAKGRYLADCAGDDFWVDDHKLQAQYEILETRRDVTLVATRWLQFNENTGVTSVAPNEAAPGEYNGKKLLAPILAGTVWIHLCSALFRRDVIANALKSDIGFYVNPDFSCEDLQILLLCAREGNIIILPQITLYYTVGHESVSHNIGFEKMLAYSSKAFGQSLTLQKKFFNNIDEEDRKRINRYNDRLKSFIILLQFRSGPEACAKTNISYDLNPKSFSVKTLFYKISMSNKLLWKSMLALRNLFPG